MKKLFSLLLLGVALHVSAAETVVYTFSLPDNRSIANWDNTIQLGKDGFAEAREGDIVRFSFTTDATSQLQLCENNDGWGNLLDCVDVPNQTSYDFVLSAQAVADVLADGLYVQGKNLTLTAALLVRSNDEAEAALTSFEGLKDFKWSTDGEEHAVAENEDGSVSFANTPGWTWAQSWVGDLDASAFSAIGLELTEAVSYALELTVVYTDNSSETHTLAAGEAFGVFDLTQSHIMNLVLSDRAEGPNSFSVKRLFFVSREATKYERSVTSDRFGTLCLPQGVAANSLLGASVFSIAGKTTDGEGAPLSLQLTEEKGQLTAGQPYIFKANASTLLAYGMGDEAAAGNHNGLHGALETTDVAEGMYVVSNNKVKKCGTGCSIAANRAYINMDEVAVYAPDTEVRAISLGFDDTETALSRVEAETTDSARVYNLQGMEVKAPGKGLYIVGGKKVVF